MKKGDFTDLAYFRSENQLRQKWCKGVGKITPSDRTWVRYMLMLWGADNQGDDLPDGGNINVIGRLMVRDTWDDGTTTAIKLVMTNYAKLGYTGKELLEKVKEVIMPHRSTLGALRLAKEKDDAEFVEKCMTEIFTIDNPIRDVVIKRYKKCKSSQNILEALSHKTGIDIDSAKRRIRWANKAAEDMIYSIMSERNSN
ncbi:hypothetical protein [Xenorhabdus bovienii]|uniref:Uncharacterized protein n=1 Tax=Xenorhabdus bovienii str. Intermedium TaxID=1379677 RepID=A0A077QNA9_XENBV|nr:hypothetical protein [Xenorhabdus bovienii]CDH33746.1 hypothetical protein XBI1_2770002 [Xenorhabdus bovienii str. Intermedium]